MQLVKFGTNAASGIKESIPWVSCVSGNVLYYQAGTLPENIREYDINFNLKEVGGTHKYLDPWFSSIHLPLRKEHLKIKILKLFMDKV